MTFDPYFVLKVSKSASPAEIEEAYRALAEIYDTDRFAGSGSGAREEAARRMNELRQARAILLARHKKLLRPRPMPRIPLRDLLFVVMLVIVVIVAVIVVTGR